MSLPVRNYHALVVTTGDVVSGGVGSGEPSEGSGGIAVGTGMEAAAR